MSLSAFATEVHALLQTPDDRWMIGAWHLGAWGSPDRFVWVPTTSQFEAPMSASNASQRQPRNIGTHRMTVEIHIWSETLDSTITLLHAVYAAVRRVGRVGALGSTARWDKAEMNERGYLVVLPIEIPFVISDAAFTPNTIATITALECDTTPSPADGWIDCPCP